MLTPACFAIAPIPIESMTASSACILKSGPWSRVKTRAFTQLYSRAIRGKHTGAMLVSSHKYGVTDMQTKKRVILGSLIAACVVLAGGSLALAHGMAGGGWHHGGMDAD